MKNKEYDVIVVGAGPTGLTAGLYAARYGLDTLVISKDIGGMANYAHIVENFPGFAGSGMQLSAKIAEQARNAGAVIMQQEIIRIEKNDSEFHITTAKNEKLKTKSVIVAIGTEKRKLGIDGEEQFIGKGVSYCAVCDAPLFKNKAVVVIGGRNSAVHAALLLAKYARIVYIVYRGKKLICDHFLFEEIENKSNIKINYDSVPVRIEGKEAVEKLFVDIDGKKTGINAEGIFVEIGSIPSTKILIGLKMKLDKDGFVIANPEMRTNISGIFAAGDITQNNIKQMITSAAQGAIAASSVYKFLKTNR